MNLIFFFFSVNSGSLIWFFWVPEAEKIIFAPRQGGKKPPPKVPSYCPCDCANKSARSSAELRSWGFLKALGGAFLPRCRAVKIPFSASGTQKNEISDPELTKRKIGSSCFDSSLLELNTPGTIHHLLPFLDVNLDGAELCRELIVPVALLWKRSSAGSR